MLNKLKHKVKQIVDWQKRPISVPPNTRSEAVCRNCGDSFQGNFCPRCGQSANTPRLGSKSAFKIFLDTWGLGTHGLLRTIWYLLTRPGYMIGDYIDGRRQLYFPPFKSLFVVGTIFAIIYALGGGFSDEAIQSYETKADLLEKSILSTYEDFDDPDDNTESAKRAKSRMHDDIDFIQHYLTLYKNWEQNNRSSDQLLMYVVYALIAWRIFRKSPRRPGMNLSENIIAHVYICVQMGVLVIFTMLLCMPFSKFPVTHIPGYLTTLFFIYDYKQLYGYSLWKTILKTVWMQLLVLAFTILIFSIFIISLVVRAVVAGG